MSSNLDSTYTCTLRPETLQKAIRELHEDPSTRLIEVKMLKERLQQVPGLVPRTDTPFLLRFLRARKFNQERAFQLVLNYYETRAKHPDIFTDLKPSRVKHVLDAGIYDTLESRDINGCHVIYFRYGNWDPDKVPVSSLLKMFFLALNKAAEDEETQVHGIHLIMGMDEFSLKQASHIPPSAAKLGVSMVQNVVPLRLKKVDYVHETPLWDTVFAIFRAFMKEKIRKRIVMNGSKVENLHKDIKPEHLPTDLGGQMIPLNNEFSKAWREAFLALDSQFEEDNKFGFVNMELSGDGTVSKSGDAEMAGLGGTFKKLDI